MVEVTVMESWCTQFALVPLKMVWKNGRQVVLIPNPATAPPNVTLLVPAVNAAVSVQLPRTVMDDALALNLPAFCTKFGLIVTLVFWVLIVPV